ncbi:MAG TPA: hypothetical protein VJT72_00955 [Pseudonocardiaceae bacterium]|nr:hypothetical protein [Pseudonocardiaceae bacterium]
MAQRMVHFSDLTNKVIDDDDTVVRIVVEQHPALRNGPVEIEAAEDEVAPIRKGALSIVSLKLYLGDVSEPEAVTMEIEEFNNLADGMDMAEIIRRAEPAYPPRKQARPAPTPAADKLDYSTLEHAGKPHRGKTTEAEKEIVRNNLAAINERLKRDGIRTIDPNNPEHVTRYDLEVSAQETEHFQQ